MAERDKYDEQIERLLPCGKYWLCIDGGHDRQCPMFYSSAVAAALRESGKREAELREMVKIQLETLTAYIQVNEK